MVDAQHKGNPTIVDWIKAFADASERTVAMALNMDDPWRPDSTLDPKRLHNMYARALVCAYARKFGDLSKSVAESLQCGDYLVYALAGRAVVETTATLHYYVHHEYAPLLNTGNLTPSDMRRLIEIDDKHLRGGRFDWESFLQKKYAGMIEAAKQELHFKKNSKGKQYIPPNLKNAQKNVFTCVEYWANKEPGALFVYNLFCELVHPNVGSAFLIASSTDEGLHFGSGKGESIGSSIADQSLPLLGAMTIRTFGDDLLRLVGTIWVEDEL